MELQVKTDLQLNKLSKEDKIILGSAVAALISLFLPWQDLGMLGTLNGISDYAWLPFILGWGLPVCMIFKELNVKGVIVFCGDLIAFLWGVIYILSATVENPFNEESVNVSSWGVFVFCLAALALGVELILKSKVKNVAGLVNMVKEDVQSFKK